MKGKISGIRFFMICALLALGACASMERPGITATAQVELRERAASSLEALYDATPEARELQKRSIAILVFPDIVKAGIIIGGSGGNGVLFSPEGKVLGYYNAASVSYGLQLGVQDYAQALFLTTPVALEYLDSSAGWSVGVGPTIVVMDEGAAKDLSTTTARSDVFAFIYGQKGLMGGIGVQGQKITRLQP